MFERQNKKEVLKQLEEAGELNRCLTLFDLVCYGLGGNIGSNFFVFIGQAIIIAGPSVCLSFLYGGIISFITALCFAELSNELPTNGA